MTFIHFFQAQWDGTVIHCDVDGLDVHMVDPQGSSELRNPVDAIQNLIYFLLLGEVTNEDFDTFTFSETSQRCTDRNYLCDGAITEQLTGSVALSRLCTDFNLDFIHIQTSGALGLHMYDAVWSNRDLAVSGDDSDRVIPLDVDKVLLKTLKPALPPHDQLFNRFRYRYSRQNAGLTEWAHNSETGQWGFEYTVDNVNDQDEIIGAQGSNPLFEKILNLYFIRDDDTAYNTVVQKMGYHTLRSYICEFELPALSQMIASTLDLATPFSMTHFGGIADGGWTGQVFKVMSTVYDLKSYKLTVKGAIVDKIADYTLIPDITPTAEDSFRQPNYPQIATRINGSLNPASAPHVDINDDYPIPPTPVTVDDGGASFGVDPPTPSLNGKTIGIQKVMWQEAQGSDTPVDHRLASAFVPDYLPLILGGLRMVPAYSLRTR